MNVYQTVFTWASSFGIKNNAMARIKKLDPLLGDARGRVGPAVLTKVRGVPVIKIRPSINRKLRKKKNKGKPESDQTLKMGLVSPFIRKISNYTSIGFDKYKTGKAAFPSAVQYTIKYALAGKNPDFVINYPEVVISVGKGSLPGQVRSYVTTKKWSLLPGKFRRPRI